jgi:hypothetical protein
MSEHATEPTRPAVQPGDPALPAYQPPRLTGKHALEQVTLFSFRCTPGDPGCWVGHP